MSYRKFGKCDDYDVSPDETRGVISTHGEILTRPLDQGRVGQITDGPARDRKPRYSPDGKKIAFISDRTKQDEVYVVDADGKNLVKVTDSDTRKYEFDWSPDGKHISVSRSDNTLWVYNLEEKSGRLLLKYEETAPRGIYWSPDGRWIAFLKANKDLEYDACIISAIDNSTVGTVEHIVVENLPFDEWIVAFTKEKLFFLSSTELEGTNHLYAVSLAREAEDPDDPEVKAARAKKKPGAKKPPAAKPKKKEKGEGEKPGSEKPGDEKPEKKEEKKKEIKLPEVKIDFDRIEKRVRKLFEVKGELKSAAVSPDGKKIVAVVTEPVADEEKDNLYLFDPEAEKSKFKKIGSVKEVSSLGFSPKGKEIFYLSGGRLYHRAPGPGSPKPVAVSVKVKVDTAKEFEQIFHECWRMLKHAFYDPDMHEVDWEAMRDKYAAVLPSVTDRDALGTVINRMLGELKASHMGYYAPREPSSGVSTLSFGLELEADAESGLYRIGHIYEYGPALKDWANVSEGDYLFAVDGKPLAAGDNYHRMLNHPLNDRLDLTVGPNADGSDNRSTRIKLIGSTGLWRLRYRKWVDDNRRRVEERSGGRLAYTHILSMSRPYLEQFKRELMQYRQKEGVVIDVRNNGGGYIDVYLLDFLEKKKYGYRTYNREAVKIDRPRHGFYGPKVVLTNEYSFSNAEIFPRGFRDLGLGKLIGIKTGGGVIGTSSYTLIDGSRIRTPVVGAYARDGTNLENWGVNPDIKIDRTPEDDLVGRYPQLDGAIDELLKSLPAERQK
ncbi:MAG: hypothetical protein E3J72_19665 [Planctomycetota bacterium]|nr:MAG: hypothetical protein E3J72_19665 [Planctomycetota bacterium]